MNLHLYLKKQSLLLVCGLVWTFAGTMVSSVGLPLLCKLPSQALYLYLFGAALVFSLFYFLIFSKLLEKNIRRIKDDLRMQIPFYQFFSPSSYAIMIFMMSGGLLLRLFHLLPESFIAFFYSGLGFALLLCGLKYFVRFFQKGTLHSVHNNKEKAL